MNQMELIKRCQLGDLESLSELYKLYVHNALGTAYLIAGRKGLAEDIVQEAFIQCFQGIKNLKCTETFDVWFYKVLMRTGWRMVSKHSGIISIDDIDTEISQFNYFKTRELESTETSMTVHEALNKLSLPLKTVVILHYFNDMTVKEIAKVLGCFEGTVKSRLYKARKLLYETLNENHKEYNFQSGDVRKGYKIDENHANV